MKTFHNWLEKKQDLARNIGVYLAMRDQDWKVSKRTINAFEILVEDLISSGMWKEDFEKWDLGIEELAKDAYSYYRRHMEF